MAFLGKIAYLLLFPGLAFILLAGALSRGLMGAVSSVVSGAVPSGPPQGFRSLFGLLDSECVPADGPLHAMSWLAPVVKLFALSWLACVIAGFIGGDVFLAFALLVTAATCDILLAFSSSNPRVRENGREELLGAIAWLVPLALILCTVSIRVGGSGLGDLSGLVAWQERNGVLLAASRAGGLALAGSILAFIAALPALACFARLRPLGRAIFSEPPCGIASELSGPTLAFERASGLAGIFVGAFLLVAVFLGGPASTWYEVLFWFLKIAAVVLLAGVVDSFFARMSSRRALVWMLAGSGGLAVLALALTWAGVAR